MARSVCRAAFRSVGCAWDLRPATVPPSMSPCHAVLCPPLVFQVMLLIDGREHFTDLKGHNRTSSLQQHLDKVF